jgi:oxygen-independent coproporphyrinogen-3 oxidase
MESSIPPYLDALEKEAEFYETHFRALAPDTLYIGGGTPGLLTPEQIGRLADIINRRFQPVTRFAESTFEANPETLTDYKIAALKKSGFNRISLGLQSFDDGILKFLGRGHSAKDFIAAYNKLRGAGFANINADLISGIPDRPSFLAELEKLIKLQPEHISFYALSVEDGTPFAERGVCADDELARAEYDSARAALVRAGYGHYEISNFALPGKEASHNINYWRRGEYIGLGCAAAGFLAGERTVNTASVDDYISSFGSGRAVARGSVYPSRPVSPASRFHERLEGKAALGERIILGLRMLKGIEITEEISSAFSPQIKQLEKADLLAVKNGLMRLSDEGLYLSNKVFCEFVEPF